MKNFILRATLVVLASTAMLYGHFALKLLAETPPERNLPSARPGIEIFFRDAFMRDKPQEGEWTKVSGIWEFDQAAKPGVSANPFSLHGKSENEAILVTGENWWREYYFCAALRTPPVYEEMGVLCSYRENEHIFFGFSETEGTLLKLKSGGKTTILASTKSFPLAYQWYQVGVAVTKTVAYGVIDGKIVLEAALPFETCGSAGIYLRGAPDYGVTVDDCAATSLATDPQIFASDIKTGFSRLLRTDRIGRQRFPAYFSTDHLMKKWASNESDWVPILTLAPADVPQPPPTAYYYCLPVFGEVSLKAKLSNKIMPFEISLAEWSDDGFANAPVLSVVMKLVGGNLEGRILDGAGKELKAVSLPAPSKEVLLTVTGAGIRIEVDKKVEIVPCPTLAPAFTAGAKITVSPDTFEFAKSGDLALDSPSIIEETFYESPVNWLMAYGNWEMGSRWACSPQYTYLSSWDPMSSQLYSKHLFAGKFYCDVWMSPKMVSFRLPYYYPMRWFSVSMPDVAGDFSTGITAAACYPTPTDMTLFMGGKAAATTKIAENMNTDALHNSWVKMRIERGAKETRFSVNLVDERPAANTFIVSSPKGADDKPRALALWNSLTGVTITRCRISCADIRWGALEESFVKRAPLPCGVDSSLEYLASDNAISKAPVFDFSKGSAGWAVPSNQPVMGIYPLVERDKRIGINVTAPFCGSRLVFESPKLAVDAHVWQRVTVRYRSNVTLAFYIHVGGRAFRVLLNGRGLANPGDWAIPVDAKYVRKVGDGNFTSVSVDLLSMLEEYIALEGLPIVTKISLERLDIESPESLGVEARDSRAFSIGLLEFTSSLAPATIPVTTCMPANAIPTTKTEVEFVAGIGYREIKLNDAVLRKINERKPTDPYYCAKGAMHLTFKEGFHGLTAVGALDETQLWLQQFDREPHMVVNKTGLQGYYGVRLLPKPISLLEYPALTIKMRQNVSSYFLMVKAGNWVSIPLIPQGGIDEEKKQPPAIPKGFLHNPLLLWSPPNAYYMVNLAERPELKDKTKVEEVFLMSTAAQTVACGTVTAISSILFYDPQRVGEFGRKTPGTVPDYPMTQADGTVRFTVREIQIESTKTRVFVEASEKRAKVTTAKLLSSDAKACSFELDAPVTTSELKFAICGRAFTGAMLSYGATPNIITIPRAEIYNPKAEPAKWELFAQKEREWVKVSEGEIPFADANPLKIERLAIIPDDLFLFQDFELGIGTGGSRLAPGFLAGSDPFMGNQSIESIRLQILHASYYLNVGTFDAVRYPLISFNYKVDNANYCMMFRCEGHYKDVGLTDCDVPLELYKDIYYRIGRTAEMSLGIFGKVKGFKADGRWRHCNFNMLDLLQAKPFGGRYPISEIAVRQANLNPDGVWSSFDNIIICGHRSKTFKVRIEPPLGYDAKFEYEWVLLDSTGKPLGTPAKTALRDFVVELPKERNLIFSISPVIAGVTGEANKIPLYFTAPERDLPKQ